MFRKYNNKTLIIYPSIKFSQMPREFWFTSLLSIWKRFRGRHCYRCVAQHRLPALRRVKTPGDSRRSPAILYVCWRVVMGQGNEFSTFASGQISLPCLSILTDTAATARTARMPMVMPCGVWWLPVIERTGRKRATITFKPKNSPIMTPLPHRPPKSYCDDGPSMHWHNDGIVVSEGSQTF